MTQTAEGVKAIEGVLEEAARVEMFSALMSGGKATVKLRVFATLRAEAWRLLL